MQTKTIDRIIWVAKTLSWMAFGATAAFLVLKAFGISIPEWVVVSLLCIMIPSSITAVALIHRGACR
jgi:hypothetical protein